jgi:cytochrome c553
MTMIKSGARAVPLMAGQLDALKDQDFSDLAAYFSGLKAPVGQAAPESLALGERIYRAGIANKGVPACTACHSPTGSGNALAGFPHLGGQPVQYVTTQLTAYREGNRATDESIGGVMRGVAQGLTDAEIAAVANYVHGLH